MGDGDSGPEEEQVGHDSGSGAGDGPPLPDLGGDGLGAGTMASRAIGRLGLNQPRRVTVAISGVVVVVLLVAVLVNGDDSGGRSGLLPVGSASVTAATTGSTVAATGVAADGPQVPPIASCGLLTTPELDAALGLEDVPFVDRSILTSKLGEGCTWQNVRDGETVQGLSLFLGPGSPDDFAPGATLNGRTGTALEGVGDLAVWFAGADGGTLSVAKASSLGYVFLRIALERPDTDDHERRRAAVDVADVAIYRLPGVEARPLATIVFDPEPPDPSTGGLADNLLAREGAGEWTRGEGLLATLQLLAGEADAASVLRDPGRQPAFQEATGIVDMAQEYLIVGSDEPVKEEIAALLGRLVFTNEQLEAMAGIDAAGATATAGGTAVAGVGLAASRSAPNAVRSLLQGATDCKQFFYDFEVSPGVGDCLEWEPVNIGPGVEDKYRIFVPAPSMPQAGWTRFHFQNARIAMQRAAAVYEGLGAMPKVNVVFSVAGGGNTLMSATNQGGGKPCGVFVFTSSQSITTPQFQQTLAHELAHCFTARNMTPQSRITYAVKKWWEEGVAEYLSNVVYDSVNFEWDWRDSLSGIELGTSVVTRDYENFAFFQHMANESSTQGALTLIATLPGCGTISAELSDEELATCASRGVHEQAAVLANYLDILERHHAFVERLTDASVKDTGGRTIPYKPPAIPITEPGQYEFPLNAFEVSRLHLQVPDGLTACLNHEPRGGTVVSWRTGEPDGIRLERQWERNLPRTLGREAVFVATTISDGAVYSLEVRDIVEKPSDCHKDVSQDSSCDLELCGPSDFFKNPDQLEDWLTRVLPPLRLP